MKRKITALCLVVAMLAVAIIGSTMAYFTDTDNAVNVMTMGNVDVEMYEKNRDSKDFSEYNKSIQILPAVYSGDAPSFADNADIYWDGINNAIDKTITVENTGKSPAYVRTWLAFEVIDGVMHYNFGDTTAANAKLEWLGTTGWISSYTDRSELAVTNVNGINYYIARYTYLDALADGDTSSPSLIEFALDKSAENADVTGIGDNYEILAVTQAIQSAGFSASAGLSAAEVALSEFGDDHPFASVVIPSTANTLSVTPENIANIDFKQDDTTYKFEGEFSDLTIPSDRGLKQVFDGSDATVTGRLLMNFPSSPDHPQWASEERSGNVTITGFTVDSLAINARSMETLNITANTAKAISVFAANLGINLDSNTVDGDFGSYDRFDDTGTQTEYGMNLMMISYDLAITNNTVTDAKSHVIGINGSQDMWSGKNGLPTDIGNDNKIVKFSGNKVTVNSTDKSNRAALKIWNDTVYAPNSAPSTVNAAAQALIDAILADTTNVFTLGAGHYNFSIYNVNTNA